MVDYNQAWSYQEKLFQEVIVVKTANRLASDKGESVLPTHNYLLFCQHPSVFTLGKSGDLNHLLLDEVGLEEAGATFYKINRGGDITFHGPGQLVGYPILDLDNFITDIDKYLRILEQAIIDTCSDYGVVAGRIAGLTGVWVNDKKICAIGVRTSRWVTMHGFAFNINTDLSFFGKIIPCGITDKEVTSLAQELGSVQQFDEVSKKVLFHLEQLLGLELL